MQRGEDVTIVTAEGDPEILVDVVRGDARAALALFHAVRPNQDDYGARTEGWEDLPPSAEVQVRVYLAEQGFQTVPYVRAALTTRGGHMIDAVVPRPGSLYGPCDPLCLHKSCRAQRAQALWACLICGAPLGYERAWLWEDGGPVHKECPDLPCALF